MEAERGKEAGLLMRQVYMQMSKAIVATLSFSDSLGKPRGVFLIILSLQIQDAFTDELFRGNNCGSSYLSLSFYSNCSGTPSI